MEAVFLGVLFAKAHAYRELPAALCIASRTPAMSTAQALGRGYLCARRVVCCTIPLIGAHSARLLRYIDLFISLR